MNSDLVQESKAFTLNLLLLEDLENLFSVMTSR